MYPINKTVFVDISTRPSVGTAHLGNDNPARECSETPSLAKCFTKVVHGSFV